MGQHVSSQTSSSSSTAATFVLSSAVMVRSNGILNRWRAIEVATLQVINSQATL